MRGFLSAIFYIFILGVLTIAVAHFALGWNPSLGSLKVFSPFDAGKTTRVQEDTTALDMKAQAILEEARRQKALEDAKALEEQLIDNSPVTLFFTGDVMVGQQIQNYYKAKGVDGIVSPYLQQEMNEADITMINCEFPFSERGEKVQNKQYTFRTNPSFVSLFNEMGVDVAGLANNHTLDYGVDALDDTITTLENAGISSVGAGVGLEESAHLVVKEIRGKTFGFLAASRIIPFGSWDSRNSKQTALFTCYDPTNLINAIKSAKEQCDYVYVMVHWGNEHTTKLTSYQVSDGHAYIDAGADGVIGMHSHCLQPIEFYNEKPIFYGLGNYIFSASEGPALAVKFIIDDENQVQIKLIITYETDGLTSERTGEKARKQYDYLQEISKGISIDDEGLLTQ